MVKDNSHKDTLYIWLYGDRYMVKDHSHKEEIYCCQFITTAAIVCMYIQAYMLRVQAHSPGTNLSNLDCLSQLVVFVIY